MNVVPCGGNVTPPLLGCGPAVLCGEPFEPGVDPPFALLDDEADPWGDVDAAWPELPDEVLIAWLDGDPPAEFPPAAAFEPDVFPHAASSSTELIPAATAHPLLRIVSLSFTDGPRRARPPGVSRPP
jgi:hypothetical protein